MVPSQACLLLFLLIGAALVKGYQEAHDRDQEEYERLRQIDEEVKRSRFAACILFTPGSNCDHMDMQGSRQDEDHWRNNSPGRRRRRRAQVLDRN